MLCGHRRGHTCGFSCEGGYTKSKYKITCQVGSYVAKRVTAMSSAQEKTVNKRKRSKISVERQTYARKVKGLSDRACIF